MEECIDCQAWALPCPHNDVCEDCCLICRKVDDKGCNRERDTFFRDDPFAELEAYIDASQTCSERR